MREAAPAPGLDPTEPLASAGLDTSDMLHVQGPGPGLLPTEGPPGTERDQNQKKVQKIKSVSGPEESRHLPVTHSVLERVTHQELGQLSDGNSVSINATNTEPEQPQLGPVPSSAQIQLPHYLPTS